MNAHFNFNVSGVMLLTLLLSTSCFAKQISFDAYNPGQEKSSQKTDTKPSKANVSLNIMTFNILWDKVTKGPTQWTYRKQGMVNLIKRHHPDIIGIQEGFISQMNYLKVETGLTYLGWGTDDGKWHLDNPGQRQSINPIMYNPKRFTILEKGVFWYSEQPELPGRFSGEDAHFRNCVWAKFKEKGAKGKIFYVFNTHFSLKDDMRQKQAALLKSKIEEIAGADDIVIVTGDFNSDPVRDASYSILVNPVDKTALKDTKSMSIAPATGPAFSGSGLKVNSRKAGNEIDHIFVRNVGSCLMYKTISDYEGECYPSDHFPVLSVLKY